MANRIFSNHKGSSEISGLPFFIFDFKLSLFLHFTFKYLFVVQTKNLLNYCEFKN